MINENMDNESSCTKTKLLIEFLMEEILSAVLREIEFEDQSEQNSI